jgi:hypothetical protein
VLDNKSSTTSIVGLDVVGELGGLAPTQQQGNVIHKSSSETTFREDYHGCTPLVDDWHTLKILPLPLVRHDGV